MISPAGRHCLRWSIFCRVVDNFGDIGVCWRLARVLAMHHERHVTLWLDDLETLHRLCPALSPQDDAQQLEGVLVRRWVPPFSDVGKDDVVIEAFACELPQQALEEMAVRRPPPVWINLEYLSAEQWIEGCHRLPSPHPSLPLIRHFFFPGFTDGSGGLLREPGLIERSTAFQADPATREDWLRTRLGRTPRADALVISLFAYEQPLIGELLRRWAEGDRTIEVLVPEGRVLPDIARHFGRNELPVGACVQDGALTLNVIPFSTQDDYDRLLWACDLNFVRGEDSFVRAQWAARSFVWHIYRQPEDAHLVKLEAFLDLFLADAERSVAEAVAGFWRAWNGMGDAAAAWPAFAAVLPAFAAVCRTWSQAQATRQDLATALLEFSETGV